MLQGGWCLKLQPQLTEHTCGGIRGTMNIEYSNNEHEHKQILTILINIHPETGSCISISDTLKQKCPYHVHMGSSHGFLGPRAMSERSALVDPGSSPAWLGAVSLVQRNIIKSFFNIIFSSAGTVHLSSTCIPRHTDALGLLSAMRMHGTPVHQHVNSLTSLRASTPCFDFQVF